MTGHFSRSAVSNKVHAQKTFSYVKRDVSALFQDQGTKRQMETPN